MVHKEVIDRGPDARTPIVKKLFGVDDNCLSDIYFVVAGYLHNCFL